MNKRPETVGQYIAAAPAWAKGTLRDLRKAIKTAAPAAKESISYHTPYYNQNGRLAYFAVHTNHCGFYWISNQDKQTFKKELASQKAVGNTLQIPNGKKVPMALIKKLVRSRVKQNQLQKKKKASE